MSSRLLSIKPFRNLWLGQTVSQLGDAFYFVIFAFMVKRVTGSSSMVGFVSALEMLPYLLLSPYAGVLADRIDRRKIMLASDMISAGLLLSFGLLVWVTGKPPVWAMMLAACSLSTIRVFFMPAKGAAVPAVVPTERMLEANAFSMTTMMIMPLISLSISASVISTLYAISPTWFFLTAILLNSTSFLGSAIFIAKLPKLIPDRERAEEAHPLEDMRAGLRYIWGRHELTVLLALQLATNLLISPFFVVYMEANDRWFGGKPSTLAWFEFSFFVGMTAGSLALGRYKIKRVGLWYVVGVGTVGVCVALMALSRHFEFFVMWNVLAGLMLPCAIIPVQTYLQVTVPDAFRGRVNSALNMTGAGIQPIGMALGGTLVESAGLVGGFLTMGVGMGASAAFGLLDGKFRTMVLPAGADLKVEDGGAAEESLDAAAL